MKTRELVIERPITFLKKQRIFRDRLLRWFLVLAAITMLAVVVLLLVRLRPHDFVMPLEYMTGVGLGNPGQWYSIYGYGIFSIVVTLANSILAMAMLEKSRITSFFLVVGAIIVNVFILVVVYTLLAQIY